MSVKKKVKARPHYLQLAITEEQMLWVNAESERTGDAKTVVIRRLIQAQVEKVKCGL